MSVFHWKTNGDARRRTSSTDATSGRSRWVTAAAIGGAVAMSIGAIGAWSPTAGALTDPALLPVFPDNLLVFPDRDFVSVTGYTDYGGALAQITVTRPGVGVVGSSKATVSGTDVAFEINHPGGQCWGNLTSLQVTPDIQPHDVVSIDIPATGAFPALHNETVVLDVQASDAILDPTDLTGKTMLVNGHIGPEVDPANLEQRIIEPGLVDTLGKRAIRAVPGGLVTAPTGGYASDLVVDPVNHTFQAIYQFDLASDAAIAVAASLGERAMAWEFVDGAANRQGMTIAEFGEKGGPGVGGCPNGPAQAGPNAPTSIVATRSLDGTFITVNWIPAVAVPGTPAITGYRVDAINTVASAGVRSGNVRFVDNVAANGVTISGLDPAANYSVGVSSVSSAGYTFPAVNALFDTTPPTITSSVADGTTSPVPVTVSLTASEPNVNIFYTLDGSAPIDPVLDTFSGTPYTGPITISSDTLLRFGGFDLAGNASAISDVNISITSVATPDAPTNLVGTPGVGSVDLTWTEPLAGAGVLVDNVVKVYDSAAAVTPIQEVTVAAPATSAVVSGLLADSSYWFTVAARNDQNPTYGPASALAGPVVPLGVTANAGPDQLNVARSTVVTLSAAGSSTLVPGVTTYQWAQVGDAAGLTAPAAIDTVALTGATTASPTFTVPLGGFTNPTAGFPNGQLKSNGPLYFRLTVTRVGAGSKSDIVSIVPRNDAIVVATAKWKVGDFRLTGTGTINGATVSIRNAANVQIAVATVTAGAWTVRVQTGPFAAAGGNPGTVIVYSNQGGISRPFAT